MSAHIRTPYSPFFKLLEFLNNKFLQQKGRSVTQFEHCRHLPFKGKKCKSEHVRSRDREKVRLSQAQGSNIERIITAVDSNCHPCKYEQRKGRKDWQGSEKLKEH